jgi:hypothetical protein
MHNMPMKRTTIMLPPDLKNQAGRRARQMGISFGEFVRRALAGALTRDGIDAAEDPLFADRAVHGGEAPADASARHDDHLYRAEP